MSPFDRLFKLMTKPLVVILYMTVIALLTLYWDKIVSSYFFHEDLRHQLPILSYLTRLGLGILYFFCFLLLIVCFRYIWKNPLWEARVWFLFLCLAIPTLICIGLKMLFGRARPNMFLQGSEPFYGFYGLQTDAHFWSFPSGHTTTIMGVVLGLGILFPRYFYAFLILGITVAFSRVLLTHHFLSDVLFTIYLTVIEIGCLVSVLRRKSWLAPAWKHAV